MPLLLNITATETLRSDAAREFPQRNYSHRVAIQVIANEGSFELTLKQGPLRNCYSCSSWFKKLS